MRHPLVILLAGVLSPVAVAAQGAGMNASPVADTIRQQLQRESKNLTAAAEEMPAGKYAFRPTEPQMTFGHLIMHIAQSNVFLCSKIAGAPAPRQATLADTDPKDTLVQAVRASFEYCTTALAKVDDSGLAEPVELFGGRKVSRAAAIFSLSNDWADHYSAAAIYLRLNGLLPPTAQPKTP